MPDPYGYPEHKPATCTQLTCNNQAVFEVRRAANLGNGTVGKFVVRRSGTKNNGSQLCKDHAKVWFENMLSKGLS